MDTHIQFMDKRTTKLFSKTSKVPLFKVTSLENSFDEFENHYIWFCNPAEWKDPYEQFFYRSTYNTASFGLKDRCFIACFSPIRVLEPQWTIYSGKEYSLAIEYNKEKLLQAIENFCLKNKCNAYIGHVQYKTTKKLLSLNPKKYCSQKTYKSFKDKNWCKLLFLKRNAFMYENELRIVLVFPDPHPCIKGKEMEYDDNIPIINSITTDPHLLERTRQVIKQELERMFPPLKNAKGRTQHVVRSSQLYDSLKSKLFK